MAWRRVRHPSEVVQVGEELTAKVLKFDPEKNRVSLGVKQLGDDPVDARRRVATRRARACSARSRTSPTTARSSKSSRASKAWCTSPKWTGRTRTSPRRRCVALGDEVEVMVLEIDEEQAPHQPRHEAVQGEPVGGVRRNVPAGDKVKGPIKSITDFGVFIGLAARHRRPGAPVRPVLERAGRRSRAQLQEGPGSRSHRAGHRRRARAHLAGHQAARRRPVHQLHLGQRPRRARHRQGQDGRRRAAPRSS